MASFSSLGLRFWDLFPHRPLSWTVPSRYAASDTSPHVACLLHASASSCRVSSTVSDCDSNLSVSSGSPPTYPSPSFQLQNPDNRSLLLLTALHDILQLSAARHGRQVRFAASCCLLGGVVSLLQPPAALLWRASSCSLYCTSRYANLCACHLLQQHPCCFCGLKFFFQLLAATPSASSCIRLQLLVASSAVPSSR